METISIETTESPTVLVEARGKLSVKGWDRLEVRAKYPDKNSLTFEQDGDQFKMKCVSRLELNLPHGALLEVPSAMGETYIRGIHGAVSVAHASGKLILRDVREPSIESVGGELNARDVDGSLSAKQISGSLYARGIAGNLEVEQISGHLNLTGVLGSVSAQTSGNANLDLEPVAGSTHKVRARGVLNCRVPADLDAEVTLSSSGPLSIKVGEVTESKIGGELTHTFKDGAAKLQFSASGPAALLEKKTRDDADFDFDFQFNLGEEFGAAFGGIADEISSQVTEQLAAQMEMLDTQLEQLNHLADLPGMTPEKTEKIAQKARERTEKARIKIQKASEKAQKRMAQKIAAAQSRAERKVRRTERRARIDEQKRAWSFSQSGTPAGAPVSDEERMMILRMLAEKKISAEEAELLLAALEGKGD